MWRRLSFGVLMGMVMLVGILTCVAYGLDKAKIVKEKEPVSSADTEIIVLNSDKKLAMMEREKSTLFGNDILIYDSYSYGDTNRCWNPSIVEAPNGDIFVAFYYYSEELWSNEEGYYVFKSCDKGKTWNYCYRENHTSYTFGMNLIALPDHLFNIYETGLPPTEYVKTDRSTYTSPYIIYVELPISSSGYSGAPSAVTDADEYPGMPWIYVAWADNPSFSASNIMFKAIDDSLGIAVSERTIFGEADSLSYDYPGIAYGSDVIHVFCRRNDSTLWYRQSKDFGYNWEPEILFSYAFFCPGITAHNNKVLTTWNDMADTMYFNFSTTAGSTWVGTYYFPYGNMVVPTPLVTDNKWHITYLAPEGHNAVICYLSATDPTSTWYSDTISDCPIIDSLRGGESCLGISDDSIAVVWCEGRKVWFDATWNKIGIDEQGTELAKIPSLHFKTNPSFRNIRIDYTIPRQTCTSLEIYDLQGRLVKLLIDWEQRGAGYYTRYWNGKNEGNENVSSGIYFIRLQTNEGNVSKKVIFVK